MSSHGSNNDNGLVELPPKWVATTLGDAINPERPRGLPAEHKGSPFVGLEHIEAHTTRLLGSVPAEMMRSSGVCFVQGDVLYGRMRPYLNKVWLADRAGLCSGEFIVFPGTGAFHGGFLKYRLNAQDFMAFADHTTNGDRPRADFSDLSHFPILLPPFAEQSRIADRIDELFTDLSAGVAALERVRKKLKRYRAAVLHAAVTGRLTAAWRKTHGPPAEPGDKLLARILVERRKQWEQRTLAKYTKSGRTPPKNWKTRYVEPAPPKADDLPELPKGWCWASIGRCFEVRVGGTPSRSIASYWGGQTPWVSSGEVQFCRIRSTRETITTDGVNNSSARVNPAGTVLLGMIGEGRTRGQSAILDVDAANNQNAAAVLVSMTPIPSEFVFYWLWSQYNTTRTRSSGGNQLALNADRVKAIPMPLPPLAEQSAIVEAVNEKLSQIDAMEAEVERGLARAARLRQAILKAAFAGKLVPQDPNDEPASKLLERIKAERAAGESRPPRPRRKRKMVNP
jgi:type I restriction enzyme S subunit